MEEKFASKIAIVENQLEEPYPNGQQRKEEKESSSSSSPMTEEIKLGISQASNDALFQYIEQSQQGSFGHILDAGTGSHSLRWIASLFHKGKYNNDDDGKAVITQYTAITADEAMRQKVVEESRVLQIETYGNIHMGNWFTDTELCQGKIYDCILADYLIGAMDGFSPYFQDLMFSRLSKHLHPKHGRLYIVGLNPIPDRVDGVANILCEITRLRDACILLAGHRCYREYPLEWIQRNLVQSGYRVVDTAKFPILYSHATIVRQLNVARSKLPYFKCSSLAKTMSRHIDELEERVRAILQQQGGQRIKLGFDYVVVAELVK